MPTNWEKLADLVKKTGDSVIVVNEQGEPQYVLLGMKKYQRLTDVANVVDRAVSDHTLPPLSSPTTSTPEHNQPVDQTNDAVLDKIKAQISSWKKEHPTAESDKNQVSQNQKPFDVFAAPETAGNESEVAEAESKTDFDTYYFEPED